MSHGKWVRWLEIACMVMATGCEAARPAPASAPSQTTAVNPIMTATKVVPTASILPTYTASPTTALPTATPTPDSIIYFVGDLVSKESLPRARKVVELIETLMERHPGSPFLVASTGDNEQENQPTVEDYQSYFGTTYGIFLRRGIFRPVRGNHDLQDAGFGQAYAQYFESVQPLRPISFTAGKLFVTYSFEFGGWHLIGLDQTVGDTVNAASLDFLRADLAAQSGTLCQIVYWHAPTYSSGWLHGDAPALMPLNQIAFDAGVDIQINGHDHDYQRFFPLDPSGMRDDAKGITTFIDGIGGEDDRIGHSQSAAQLASAVYLDAFPAGSQQHAIGVIEFILRATSADFTLWNANDGAVLDQGAIGCH
jgi:acid phosphatase type 7